jgi:hypothetical protein
LISSFTHWLFKSKFNFHAFVQFPKFFLLFTSSFAEIGKDTQYKFNFFFLALGFELGFALAKEALYRLNHISSPFCSGCFGDRGSLFALAGLEPQFS